jgi:hypothetical protein
MTYRDDLEAARARRDQLARELDELETQTRGMKDLEARKRDVKKQLAEADQAVAGAASKRNLPMLDDIKVASPCSARWDEMVGDARVRFCAHCEKNVFNLSAMTRDEAEALVEEKEGQLCVRFYRRTDGTMLTADCPVGVRRKRVRRIAAVAVGAGALAALGAGLRAREQVPPCTMGDIAVPTGINTTPVVQGTVAPPPPATPTMGKPTMGAVAVPTMGRAAPQKKH